MHRRLHHLCSLTAFSGCCHRADASATPATAVATSAADVAPGPPTPAGKTARHIPMKTHEQATAEGTPPAGATAAEAEAERGGPVEATAP